MSDDTADLSSVIALSNKGNELVMKGHNARAAEKFRLAADEAEKALRFPDCLVTCALRFLPSAVAVLERRKAAGTLLPGRCRPVEETYHMAEKLHAMEIQGSTRASFAETAAELRRPLRGRRNIRARRRVCGVHGSQSDPGAAGI